MSFIQLCYTRGSVIPCMMSLEGNNTAALDAMSAPGSIVVTLQRHVRYNTRRTKEKATVEEIASGIWWPTVSQASQNSSRSCFMEGEIQLSKDLRSSSDVGSFSVSVRTLLSLSLGHSFLLLLDRTVLCCSFFLRLVGNNTM